MSQCSIVFLAATTRKPWERLTAVFREAGFPTVSDDEIPCAYSRGVRDHLAFEKSYFTFTPPYTEMQLKYFQAEMQTLRSNITTSFLRDVLSEYQEQLASWPVDPETTSHSIAQA